MELSEKNFFKEIENLILDLKDIGVDKLNMTVVRLTSLVIGSDEVFNCLQPASVGYLLSNYLEMDMHTPRLFHMQLLLEAHIMKICRYRDCARN